MMTPPVSTGSADRNVTVIPEKDIRHNMRVCVFLDAIFLMGIADIQMAMQPMLVWLGASNQLIGVIMGFSWLSLVGILASPFITRNFRTKKVYMLAAQIPFLLPVLFMGLACVLGPRWGLDKPGLLGWVFWLTAAQYFFNGFIMLPHQEFVAACIPTSHRGRMAGYSFMAGGALTIASALIGHRLLAEMSKPMAFGYVLLMAYAIYQGGYITSLWGREVPTPVEKSPPAWSGKMLRAAWNDRPFLTLAVFAFFAQMTMVQVVGFINTFGFRELKMPATAAAEFMIMTQAVRLVVSGFAGHLTDRVGPRNVFPFQFLGGAVCIGIVAVMQNPLSVYLAAGAFALTNAFAGTASMALLYGIPSPENRAGHYTIQFVVIYLSAAVASITAGTLCDKFGYIASFRFYAVCVSLVFLAALYFKRNFPASEKGYS